MSTNESVTDPYEYLDKHTKWLELPEKVIKNLNLRISDKRIGYSFMNYVMVYDYWTGDDILTIAMCNPLGESTCHLNVAYVYYRDNNRFAYWSVSIEMLDDIEFIQEYFTHNIKKLKSKYS